MIFVSSDLHIFFFRHDVRHWNWSQGLPQRDATLTIILAMQTNEKWQFILAKTNSFSQFALQQIICPTQTILVSINYFE